MFPARVNLGIFKLFTMDLEMNPAGNIFRFIFIKCKYVLFVMNDYLSDRRRIKSVLPESFRAGNGMGIGGQPEAGPLTAPGEGRRRIF